MSFVEHGTWPVPTLADVLRDGWLGVQKLFHRIQECQKDSGKSISLTNFERLEEMLASWVSLPSVDNVVWREIREFVVRFMFVIKLNAFPSLKGCY